MVAHDDLDPGITCRTSVKNMSVGDDMAAYDVNILGIQDTHLIENHVETITIDGKVHTLFTTPEQWETRRLELP